MSSEDQVARQPLTMLALVYGAAGDGLVVRHVDLPLGQEPPVDGVDEEFVRRAEDNVAVDVVDAHVLQ